MPVGLTDTFTGANQRAGEPSIAGASEGGILGYASDLLGLFSKGADVYSSVKEAGSIKKQREVETKAAATVATTKESNNLVLYLVLGAVAIVGLLIFFRK